MSTRWYPIYQKGNPQLRVFLPNFWMKLVKPEDRQPSNIVTFHCSMEMTKYDIKNYLEKIYDVRAMSIRTRIDMGRFQTRSGRVTRKLDDTKVAYVTLDEDQSFEFPDIPGMLEIAQQEQKDKLKTDIEGEQLKFPTNLAPGQIGWFDAYCEPKPVEKK